MARRSAAVAGCGPAGLACALFLARAGWSVTILERFAAPAPVGSGLILQPPGLAVLAELGLEASIRALGAPIRRLFGRSQPGSRIALDIRYAALGAQACALGVHRAALFSVLHAAARAESAIAFRCGVEINGLERRGGAVEPRDLAGGRHGGFDLVVDAMGARSPLLGETRRPPPPP